MRAQKFLGKELKVENNKKDGFEYKWYLYKYLQGNDTVYAAYDLNEKRITPNSERITQNKGYKPEYIGGLMFLFMTKTVDAKGNYICVGYNAKGQQVLPNTLEAFFISYYGDGIVILWHNNDYGEKIESAYNLHGECIIPASLGYSLIYYSPEYECFSCYSINIKTNKTITYTYSADGKYFAKGTYRLAGPYSNLSEFEINKKPSIMIR